MVQQSVSLLKRHPGIECQVARRSTHQYQEMYDTETVRSSVIHRSCEGRRLSLTVLGSSHARLVLLPDEREIVWFGTLSMRFMIGRRETRRSLHSSSIRSSHASSPRRYTGTSTRTSIPTCSRAKPAFRSEMRSASPGPATLSSILTTCRTSSGTLAMRRRGH
jgi:hypothetical protein